VSAVGIPKAGHTETDEDRLPTVDCREWAEKAGALQEKGWRSSELRRPGAPFAGYEGAPEPALLHHVSVVRAPTSKQEPCLFPKTAEAADRKSRRSADWSDWGACRRDWDGSAAASAGSCRLGSPGIQAWTIKLWAGMPQRQPNLDRRA
jgi:hypothetical protein